MSKGCAWVFGGLVVVALVIGAGFWFVGDSIKRSFSTPTPVSIAQASLQGLREQNRLTTFSASYVAVVTSKQSQLGLTAQKTMIMPGSVRYEVDLSKLNQNMLSWDAAGNKLSVTLPPVEVVGPDVDINAIRQYDNGGILMTFTDAGAKLDEANRRAAQEELMRQARAEPQIRLARDAARRAIERSFAMPLRAAGLNATVEVIFADEARGTDHEVWDMSRRPADVIANMK